MRMLLLVCLFVSLAPSQPTVNEKLSEYLTAHERIKGFSGSVLVMQEGKPIVRKGIGLANREWNLANTPATKFRLGSITKQFTATAIMMLEQRGKLKLEHTLDKHIPDAPELWKKVTIHQLLSHTGGIASFTDDPTYRNEMFKPFPLPDLIARFRAKPLDFEPGSKYHYSNSGYVLLGDIIQRASGTTYEEFLAKNIFEPLSMRDTGYDHWDTILPQRAAGYELKRGQVFNADYLDMTQPHAAGALYSTVDDLYKWDQALYAEKILSQAALQRMWTPVMNNYGYGWMIRKIDGRDYISHGGGINGFSTGITRVPALKTVSIVLSNLESANASLMSFNLMELTRGQTVSIPTSRQVISINPTLFDAYAGTYQLSPTFSMKISREGGRYIVQPTNQGQIDLYPESETKFFMRVVEAQISFVKSPDGKVNEIILHQDGRDRQGKRVE